MRRVICLISLLSSSILLSACGQSGALQLPSDPNYDKRAKYLLYPDAAPKRATQSATSSDTAVPVQQQFAAPAASTSTTP